MYHANIVTEEIDFIHFDEKKSKKKNTYSSFSAIVSGSLTSGNQELIRVYSETETSNDTINNFAQGADLISM